MYVKFGSKLRNVIYECPSKVVPVFNLENSNGKRQLIKTGKGGNGGGAAYQHGRF